MSGFSITPAEIRWQDGDQPYSTQFDDVYFSRAGGLDETRHVFLKHNRLAERFAEASRFTVGELGFGTGLNFLACWQLFEQTAPADAMLHYVAWEKHPLRQDDLARALGAWPELAAYAGALLAQYPAAVHGHHRVILAGGRVSLTLIFADVSDSMATTEMQADAWFLDGFAPKHNETMWQEQVCAQVTRLSAAGATAATFTSAGAVRRGLEAAGFRVSRVPGYGRKREMVCAEFAGDWRPAPLPSPRRATVIGAGLAGASAAWGLAMRGWEVELFDQATGAGQEASSNPAAILFPFMSRAWMPHTRFYLAGLSYTRQLLALLTAAGAAIDHDFCGMVYCPKPSQEEVKLLEIPTLLGLDASVVRAVDAAEAGQLCGLAVPRGGLYFPGSGWINLQQLCRALCDHPNITLHQQQITGISPQQDSWKVTFSDGSHHETEQLVVANGCGGAELLEAYGLPLRHVRGQITALPASDESTLLSTVLCYGGYMTPAHGGVHHLGATYERDVLDRDIRAESHSENLSALHYGTAGRIGLEAGLEQLDGWAAIRTTTPDKLPLVGPLAPGLTLSLGHGSRGALSCPLAGEIIASQLDGSPALPANDLSSHLQPLRFSCNTTQQPAVLAR